MEVEITWKRTMKVWWAYLWRNILAALCAMLIGGIVGAIIGFIMGMLGASKESIQLIATSIGIVIGIGVSIIPIKLILGKDFGDFRLALIKIPTEINT